MSSRLIAARRGRRVVALLACVGVVLAGAAAATPASAAATATAGSLHPKLGTKVPGRHAVPQASMKTPASSLSAPAVAAAHLPAGTYTARLTRGTTPHPITTHTRAAAGVAAVVSGGWHALGASGLSVAAAQPVGASKTTRSTTANPADAAVTVTVLNDAQARAYGLRGLVVRLHRSDGGSGPVAVAIPDSLTRSLFGADYASRARWTEQADTTSATPSSRLAGSQAVAQVRDTAARSTVLTPQVGSQAVVMSATSSPVSATGTGSYTATSLTPASSWQVSAQTGDFSWSYPLRVPPAAAGPAPDLALSYDSGSVDGETGSTNNQPSEVGDGWQLGGTGYIERSYVSCAQDDGASGAVTTSGDLCWSSDNATLSFGGHSGQLVKTGSTWRLQGDDGSRVEHLVGSGAGCGNATYDDDCWRLTTGDGTQYYFGRNKLPGWVSGKAQTNSAWTVPVFGNDSGEPCHASTFAASACTQAWRWNLDYVVDPHGNSEAYYYDTEANDYRQNNTTVVSYIRAGYLDHIDYGMRAGSELSAQAPQRVLFHNTSRCLSSCTVHANWPDTPWDQVCTASPCTGLVSPTFFTGQMFASIDTQLLSGSSYTTVDTWTLTHSFPSPGDGTSPALWLVSVAHTGYSGSNSLALPATTFSGITLQNRVWATDGLAPLDKYRISSIHTETGAVISVNYSAQQCTPSGAAGIEAAPQNNTNRCFPQWWSPQVTPPQAPQEDLFHKYVVTSVTDDPHTGGALDAAQVTSYIYTGQPAWRFDTSPGTPDEKRTWSVFAGYSAVEVRVGNPNTPASDHTTDYTFFQGMDGDPDGSDPLHPTAATRSVSVRASDGSSVTDSVWWAGDVREQVARNGANGGSGASSTPIVSDTINTPWASTTATGPYSYSGTDPVSHKTFSGSFTVHAELTGTADAHTTAPLAAGGQRSSDTQTSYDSYGRVTQVESDTSDAGSTCTTTSYATNTSSWLLDYPARVTETDKACGQALTYPDDVVSDSATHYDGSSMLGAAPTLGDVTETDTAKDYTGSTPVWQATTRSSYDTLGRATAVTDALGNTTRTAYTPASSGPLTQTVVTDPAPYSWMTTTAFNPAWGMPTSVTDVNGHVTSLGYDALGRRTGVWLPDRSQASYPSSPSTGYAYTVSTSSALTVATTTPTAAGTNVTSYVLYDGLGRQVQSQAPADGGGTTVSDTGYDAAGQVNLTNNPYWTTSVNPSATLFVAASQQQIPSQVQTSFDGAGRVTGTTLQSMGAVKSQTTTSYPGSDRTDYTPPAGGTPTSTYIDSRGHTAKLVQYLASSISDQAPTETTSYSYDARGDMTAMTDPAGNQWSWTYNVLGQQTQASDPDTGTTTLTYDADGRVQTSTDAAGHTLYTSYDTLGRKTALYDGSPAGVELAAWAYDPTLNGTQVRGQLASSDRYIGGSAGQPGTGTDYRTAVTGYDADNRPTGTSITLPAGALGNSSPLTYTTGHYYGPDGSPTAQTDPAEAGQPAETIRYAYNSLGHLAAVTGTATYASSIVYTGIGQVAQYDLSASTSGYQAYGYDQATGAITEIKDQNATGGVYTVASDTVYGHDPAGNTTSATSTADGQPTDTQCFGYDHQDNLTQAWTPADGNCGNTPSSTNLGGPAPYWTSYTIDPQTGNRTSVVDHATSSSGTDQQDSYTYPAPGSPGPNAVSSISHATAPAGTSSWTPSAPTDSYGYNPDGATTARPGEQIGYDSQNEPTSRTTGAGTENDVYTADGQLLLQTTPSGTTAYLGDTELHEDTTGAVTATRTYTAGSTPIAERVTTAGGTSTLYWLYTDPHDTPVAETNTATGATTHRYLDPYGNPRGSTTWSSSHTYLNAPDNTFDNLIHLGARDYDPTLGRFTSVDPQLNPDDVQSVNGYAYANNNPVNLDDPTGLCVKIDSGSNPCLQKGGSVAGATSRSQTGSGGDWTQGGGSGGGSAAEPVIQVAPGIVIAASSPVAGKLYAAFTKSFGNAAWSTMALTESPGMQAYDELTYWWEFCLQQRGLCGEYLGPEVLAIRSALPGAETGAVGSGNGLSGHDVVIGSAESGDSAVLGLASKAADTTTEDGSLYRGVASDHPGYNDALNGVARPRGGPATAAEHNLGDTRSEFTSWTTDPQIAKDMSYPGGIVIRIPQSSVAGRVVQSPDLFDESEVLVRGPVFGAEPLP